MPDVIYVEEVCELLGVSISTIERLQRDRTSGFPAPHRITPGASRKGRRRRWLRQDIMAYIERQARAAQPVHHAAAARALAARWLDAAA